MPTGKSRNTNEHRGLSIGVRTRSQVAHIRDPSEDDFESSSSDTSYESDSHGATHGTFVKGRSYQGGAAFVELDLPRVDREALKRRQYAKREQTLKAGDFKSRLAKANTALMLAALPEHLPCRDTEKQRIEAVLEDFFRQNSGRCLYICGVPGTGKTATTLEVISKYKKTSEAEFVVLNCLSMATVADLYTALHRGLVGVHSGKQSAFAQLGRYFAAAERSTVIILDEMDALLTKRSTELYNLFEWCWEGKGICIIGISNTVDLPKRLPDAIQKRMGGDTLIFKPYTKNQMESIVKHRVGNLNVFEDIAIQRAAAKAHHVGEAISEMFGDDILGDLDVIEKLILACMVLIGRSRGDDCASAIEILDRFRSSARLCDLTVPRDAFLLKSIASMRIAGFLKIHDRHQRLFDRASLEVDTNDIVKIIRQDNRLEWLTPSLM